MLGAPETVGVVLVEELLDRVGPQVAVNRQVPHRSHARISLSAGSFCPTTRSASAQGPASLFPGRARRRGTPHVSRAEIFNKIVVWTTLGLRLT